jgi:dTDP-4-dehydrorhamnose 3,5-epimerase-like enzyme
MNSTIYNCSIVTLPKIHNRAGNITALNNSTDIPFDVNRVYYLYDIPGGETRGGHAHKELQQLIVAVSGSFDVTIDDGHNKRTLTLNRPNFGLHVIPGIWRDLSNFSSGAVCLVLASHKYDESDYIRNYQQFKEIKCRLT